MNRLMQQYRERIREKWAALAPHQRRNTWIIALSLFITLGVLTWFMARPNYIVVFSNLDDVNAGEISAKLNELKIPSQLQGNNILVPEQYADQARVQLAMNNLPKNGNIDFFSQSNIGGMTDNEFQVKNLMQLQSTVANTIRSIQGIQDAQVHIVMPQDRLFLQSTPQDGKASVFLQLKPGVALSPVQVAGIQQLVAHSVKGLSTENVSVVDQRGVRLEASASNDPNNPSGNVESELQIRQKLEEDLQKRIRNGLERFVGFGNVDVLVNADMVFQTSEVVSNKVEPVVNGEGIPISEQRQTETYKNAPATGGAVGNTATNPNSPNYKTVAGTDSSGEKSNIIINREVNRTTTKLQGPAYTINKYTVSIMVNSQLTDQQKQDIKNYVATSIGAKNDGSSNNDITVVGSSYQMPANPFQQSGTLLYKNPWLIGGAVAGLLLVGGSSYVIARRRRTSKEQQRDVLVSSAVELPEETPQQRMKQQLEKMAQQKPDDFVNLLRTWLAEE